MTVRWLVGASLVLAACGGRSAPRTRVDASTGDELVLYRDRAIVRQRLAFAVPAHGLATIRIRLARGVDAETVTVVDQPGLTLQTKRFADAPPATVRSPAPAPPPDEAEEAEDAEADAVEEGDETDVAETDADADELEEMPAVAPSVPRELVLVVAGAKTGPAVLTIQYLTSDVTWVAGYTLVTTPARERAVLSGAIAIRNSTGIAYRDVALRVVDADLGLAEIPAAMPRSQPLGRRTIVDGETRVPLVDNATRTMRSALVYDPVGGGLDRKGDSPDRDRALGATKASPRVIESYELPRDARTAGLPGGDARLLEQRSDGAFVLIAEARMFDASTRDASIDAITLGPADGVTGARERREITIDESGTVTEDFALTIRNARTHPIDIVLREHLYRGQNWTLAYHSVRAEKEGPQQITMRTRVPARGQATVLYVVVYSNPSR